MINKNDFIEIDFTGKITSTNEIFDTTKEADAKSQGFKTEGIKPQIISVGHEMLPKGFDADIEGKEEGKEYTLDLKPEEAFGKRNKDLIRMIPTKHFHEQKIAPERGMSLNLDGQIVKVLSSDKGRTLADFNNPLAGKPITYIYKINKKITNQKEKIIALQDFFFRQIFDYEVEEKTIIFKVPKEAEQFIKMLSPKFEEILGMKADAKTIEPKKEAEKK
ncbi:peptidylprolyl isomerase [archaeon]|jgi:FKBP-type peptidyl-prolyl cis-trans isomerase 2|nr:peptidylprolyl isomerase [archaeon]MBT7128870.1 peptidylprolyl isomerase [archaeon]